MMLREYVVEYEPRIKYYRDYTVGNQSGVCPASIVCLARNKREARTVAHHYIGTAMSIYRKSDNYLVDVPDANNYVRILGVTRTGYRVHDNCPYWYDGTNFVSLTGDTLRVNYNGGC